MISLNENLITAVQAERAGGVQVPQHWTHFVRTDRPADAIRGLAMFAERAEWFPDEWFVTNQFFEPPAAKHPAVTTVVLMPFTDGLADAIQRTRGQNCGCRVIVDVHADLWTSGSRDHLSGDGVQAWLTSGWMKPNLEKCIRNAAVVTTPHPMTVPALLAMNPQVVVVPDTPTGEVTPELVKGWDDALTIARKVVR